MYRFSLTCETKPAIEPVTLSEAKHHCRIDGSDEDVAIDQAIVTAREYAESETHRQLITATHKLWLDAFPSGIIVPRSPLQSVTSITYIDPDGETQTLAADQYQVTQGAEPGRIVPAHGCSWPSSRSQPEAVQVTFVAGYGDAAADVPASIRRAIMLLVAHLNEFHEPVAPGVSLSDVPMSVKALLGKCAVGWLW